MHGHDLALKSGTNIPADNNPAKLHESVQGRDEWEGDRTQKNKLQIVTEARGVSIIVQRIAIEVKAYPSLCEGLP